ncbi:MAG: EamA family transporter, partial [Lentisphaeria bacterium]|nr:EamA family transporter [Lentisphaeria bacterium]
NAFHIACSGNWHFWGLLAGLVLVVTILPYYAYTAGLKRLEPSTAAIAATIEPAVGTVAGVVCFQENMTFSAGMGMALILGAVFICRE